MIKFFRKIRQRLLSESKFTKYFLYAAGEIILVVIGILIALQINNSNQDGITRVKEQVYLKSLKTDFEESRLILETQKKQNKTNYDAAREIAELMNHDNIQKNDEYLSKLIVSAFGYTLKFNPNKGVLNEMINSGNMRDLENVDLKNRLASWESKMEEFRFQESIIHEYRDNCIGIISETGTMRKVFEDAGMATNLLGLTKTHRKSKNQLILKSTKFENDLLLFLTTSILLESAQYDPTKKEIEDILLLIENEIEK